MKKKLKSSLNQLLLKHPKQSSTLKNTTLTKDSTHGLNGNKKQIEKSTSATFPPSSSSLSFSSTSTSTLVSTSSTKDLPSKLVNGSKPRIPYSSGDRILLVGEGNFSFALALSNLLPTAFIVATSFDSYDIVIQKYPDAQSILMDLETRVKLLFEVDSTKLSQLKALSMYQSWTKIVFMFPHVGLSISNQQRNIEANQGLIRGFLHQCQRIAQKETEVHVTLKTGEPYDQWELKKYAKQHGFVVKRSFAFDPSVYPEYSHRRTLGYVDGISKNSNEEILGKARTYLFMTQERSLELMKLKQLKNESNPKKRKQMEELNKQQKYKRKRR